MGFKKIIQSMAERKDKDKDIDKNNTAVPASDADKGFLTAEDFPIIPASEVDLSKYQQIPLAKLSALGAAFSSILPSTRTITQTITTNLPLNTPLFTCLWPQGVVGTLVDKGAGFSGNITDLSGSGKIAGRVRFKRIDNLPIKTKVNTTIPFNPAMIAIAAALISIDQKLDDLQQKAEEILQFLKLEKQSKQRGNLNMLSEIMEEFKRDCNNETLCALRLVAVQDIKRESHQDILFYQEQIARKLQNNKQKTLHRAQKAQMLLNSVMQAFYEYQLACYLYGYTAFMEVLLQKNFDAASAVAEKMSAHAQRYAQLYADCRSQLADYRRASIDTQLRGGIGNMAKTVGQKMSAIPVLNKGPVDEALIDAGEALAKRNKESVSQSLETFAPLADSHMDSFIENVRRLDLLCNRPDSMITDGESLYILQAT